MGTALRAHAQGKKVVFVYFDKGGAHYSEEKILDDLGIEHHRYGLDRIDKVTNDFRFGTTEADKEEGRLALEKVQELFARGDVDVLVLDEVNCSVALEIIEEGEVLAVLKAKPAQLELIMAGRDAPQSFLDKADLVTEMKLIKHYFYQDELARFGLDY